MTTDYNDPMVMGAITNAPTLSDAYRVSGEAMGSNATYLVREAYIKHILGKRSTGGFFEPTKANIKKKFGLAWATANGLTQEDFVRVP